MSRSKRGLHIGASLLILIGLVFLVLGLQGTAALWQIGLGVVGVAMVLSLLTRWVGEEQEEAPKGRPAEEERGDGQRA
jgi:hypothetical protein